MLNAEALRDHGTAQLPDEAVVEDVHPAEREDDGRWIAEIRELPGVMSYGTTKEDALAKVRELARKVVAEQRKQSAETGKVKLTVTVYKKPTKPGGQS